MSESEHSSDRTKYDLGERTPERIAIISAIDPLIFGSFQKEKFFKSLIELLDTLPEAYTALGRAFAHNLDAVISVVSIPLNFASIRAWDLRFQQIHAAERIRRLKVDPQEHDIGDLSKDDLSQAQSRAMRLMTDEQHTPEGLRALAWEAFAFLERALRDVEFRSAAPELLRQGAVLTWGAFEVLARDYFMTFINCNPRAVLRLADSTTTKAKFSLKAIEMSRIAEFEFDLSDKMGSLLLEANDLADLGTIKDVYGVLFPEHAPLREAMAQKDLWLLFQRRHLIVHKRSVVDGQYLRNTSDTLTIGSLLSISVDELKRYLQVVRDAGYQILTTATVTSRQASHLPQDGH
jgi:hypothetical protein